MRLDRVLTEKKLFGDLAIAHAAGYMLEDLKLARGNAEVLQLSLIEHEGCASGTRTSTVTSTGTSLTTTVSLFLVNFRPSQMPTEANSRAIKPP